MVEARCAMSSSRPQIIFLWQALFIAAPVIILAAIALYSLHLDKASILQDARIDAGRIAPLLAKNCSEAIAKGWAKGEDEKLNIMEGLVFAGTILAPIDYPPLPSPSVWPQAMTPRQLQLWLASEEALFQKRDPASGRAALEALKSAGLPEASANAELNLLLLDTARNGTPELSRRLTHLARRYHKIETIAGASIADIALLHALRFADQRFLSEVLLEVAGRVKNYPSFLTPDLIAVAEKAQKGQIAIRNEWLDDEKTRNLLREFLRQSGNSAREGEFWFQDGGQNYLALCSPGFGRATYVAIVPSNWLESIFAATLKSISQIPSYAGVELQMGNQRLKLGLEESLGRQSEPADLLASARGKIHVRGRLTVPQVAFRENLIKFADEIRRMDGLPASGDINARIPIHAIMDHAFTINLFLADPNLLYTRYKQRMWFMSGFILLAAAAAGLGLVSAWLAFQRQARLAEMTSSFVSSVSHELRMPIASVRLMAESLEQGRVSEHEKQKGYFHLIAQECRRLASLVENVLDFSRMHQGRKGYELELVDAWTLVRETAESMRPVAEERQVRLEISESQFPNQALQPFWDGQAVQQALVNLMDNALKHSPPGAAVKVELIALEKQICISVSDQGPGIPAEEQVRIFEPFYRRGSELRRETKGIGIGLSIVKHVAEAHGGRVIVESKPGQGSRFKLELPYKNSQS
jgi:signal transduction histidine kinase